MPLKVTGTIEFRFKYLLSEKLNGYCADTFF